MNETYVVTPFSRNQISVSSVCVEYPNAPYTPYQVFAFESRIQHFLDNIFMVRGKKYKYDHFVYLDIPNQGKMITTMNFVDSDGNTIDLDPEIIRDINLEITNITILRPNYCLFYSDRSTKLFQPWVRSVIPSLIFERTVYEFFENPKTITIPKIVENGCIYLDLSDDVNYEEVIQNLSSNLNKTLEEFFEKGSLPLNQETSNVFVESENIYGQNINGEQAIERLSDLEDVPILMSDTFIVSRVQSKEQGEGQESDEGQDLATVYVVNFSKVDPEMSLNLNQIGEEFLRSLKLFLNADAVISKEIDPGYYEIYIYKNGKYIESAINIKEMFGYQFLTHNPIGLLAAQDLRLLKDTKIIYDSYNNIGGVFIPLVHLGDAVQISEVEIQLKNRMENVDAYTLSNHRIEKEIIKHQLKIISKIGEYIFVEKSPILTKRCIYRVLENKDAEMAIVGDWNFVEMKSEYIVDIANRILKDHKIVKDPKVREGEFSTLIVPILPCKILERLIELINLHTKQKFNLGRKI
jgi:hypothetical protein